MMSARSIYGPDLWHQKTFEPVKRNKDGLAQNTEKGSTVGTARGTANLPWSVDYGSVGKHWTSSISIVDADGGEVCVMTRGYQGDEGGSLPSTRNAELIVSAVNKLAAVDNADELGEGSGTLNNCQ